MFTYYERERQILLLKLQNTSSMREDEWKTEKYNQWVNDHRNNNNNNNNNQVREDNKKWWW